MCQKCEYRQLRSLYFIGSISTIFPLIANNHCVKREICSCSTLHLRKEKAGTKKRTPVQKARDIESYVALVLCCQDTGIIAEIRCR